MMDKAKYDQLINTVAGPLRHVLSNRLREELEQNVRSALVASYNRGWEDGQHDIISRRDNSQ